jgi:hypothetical protein
VVHVEARRRQDDACGVLLRLLLRPHDDRVRRLVEGDAVLLAELRGVRERGVDLEDLVRHAEAVEHLLHAAVDVGGVGHASFSFRIQSR